MYITESAAIREECLTRPARAKSSELAKHGLYPVKPKFRIFGTEPEDSAVDAKPMIASGPGEIKREQPLGP